MAEHERTATSLLGAHGDFLRAQYHDRKLLDHEPFALADVYVEPQCSELSWAQLRDRRVDPFDTRDLARHDLLERVLTLLGDDSYRDVIAIQGVAGAGKSAFTLRLCMALQAAGLSPVRIRLRDLQLDRHVHEALPAAMRYPAARPDGKVMPERSADLFRDGRVFEQAVQLGTASIAPVVMILDGWDELSVTATIPFHERLERFLEQVRSEYLADGRDPLIRVILTGRPSLAFTETRFLRDTTTVLTLLPLTPDRVDRLLRSIAAALSARRLTTTSWDEWRLNEAQVTELSARYEADFRRSLSADQRHAPSSAVEILGLPLLAFITVRLVGEWRGGIGSLIDSPTVLMRSLVDLTCLKSGQVASDAIDLGDRARVSGQALRRMLRHTAVAISVRGEETISFDELKRRLEHGDFERASIGQTANYPLVELLVSYFFKGGRKELGCEFVHKSFREYLFAEEIVEALKDFGRVAGPAMARRAPYWKDFAPTDPRFAFSRQITALTGRRWLASEVVAHVLRLIEWELSRGHDAAPAEATHLVTTTPLDLEGWWRVRDGLADLWDWWGEGVHLRPQPTDTELGTQISIGPPYAHSVIEEALDVPRPGAAPTAIPRVIAVDARLGDALFRLCAFVHTRIAWMSESPDQEMSPAASDNEPASPPRFGVVPDPARWPQQTWWNATAETGRPYQTRVGTTVVFRPAGADPAYFENYVARINGAGWRPEGRFPAGVDGSGLDLANTTVVGGDGGRGPRTCWARASLQNARLVGCLAGHDFTAVFAPNLNASFANLEGARFTDALLVNVDLECAALRNVEFRGAFLQDVRFWHTCLDYAVFHGAVLREFRVVGATMRAADLRMADLTNIHFWRVDLTDVAFTRARLNDVTFRLTNLSDADVRGVTGSMAISDSIVQGVRWRELSPDEPPDPDTDRRSTPAQDGLVPAAPGQR